jgi:hypothetical protein
MINQAKAVSNTSLMIDLLKKIIESCVNLFVALGLI